MAVTIQTRRDQAADWATANPVLALGEIGIETDTNKSKYGDGFTAWNDLAYWFDPDLIGAVIPNGSADGQVLRWDDGNTTWEATSDIVVDATGNVGIGIASPAYNLDINQNSGSPELRLNANDGSSSSFLRFTSAGSTKCRLEGALDSSMRFETANSERVRIDANGNVLVGKTAVNLNAAGIEMKQAGDLWVTRASHCITANRIAGNGNVQQFYIDNAIAGHITTTSGGTPAFAAGSDAALKENIADIGPQLANVMALQPRSFSMKDTGTEHEGFIAQEVEPIWPDLVGDGDGELEGYKTLAGLGTVETRLIKAIQELTARVEQLEAQL